MICDGKHERWFACDDPFCHFIPTKCPGERGHPDRCNDVDCVNPRGYNRHVREANEADTPRKMWDVLSGVMQDGPVGTPSQRKAQKRRFHRETVALKKEIADLIRPRVIEFIDRWRTPHVPGED